MENLQATDDRNLILYHPETGKIRKLRFGFSWLFFLVGVFGFFFRGLHKDGLLWLMGLIGICLLFDREAGYFPLVNFKHVGSAVGIALALTGNMLCFQRFIDQGYKLNRTSSAAAAKALKDGRQFFKNVRYAEIKQELEQIAAKGQA